MTADADNPLVAYLVANAARSDSPWSAATRPDAVGPTSPLSIGHVRRILSAVKAKAARSPCFVPPSADFAGLVAALQGASLRGRLLKLRRHPL
jgi:hypothetical protein